MTRFLVIAATALIIASGGWPKTAAAGESAMRVLVAEDEAYLADIIQKGLREEGYVVDVAYSGDDGLFMAENEPSDLIILNIMLPAIDGITKLHGGKIEIGRQEGVGSSVFLYLPEADCPQAHGG